MDKMSKNFWKRLNFSGQSSSAQTSTFDSEVEEINKLVRDIEERLVELQRNDQSETLNVIFQSNTFQVWNKYEKS